MADAGAPPAKKARVDVPKSYKDLDVAAASLKVVEGKADKFYLPLFGEEVVKILLTPDGPTRLVHGFDMHGTYEQRSFNSEGTGSKRFGAESLAIQVELDSAQVSFLQSLDARLKELFPTDESFEWVPLVRTSDRYAPTAKVNICLRAADETGLTLLKFISEGQVLSGHGWEFLKERAAAEKSGQYAFGGGEVKVVAKLRAWSMTGKDGKIRKGLSLAATQLFIKPREKVLIQEADVLEPW